MPYLYRRSNSPVSAPPPRSSPDPPRPPSTPRNPWHAAYTTRAWVATTLPSARRPIRLPPDFQSFHSTILSCFRSDLSVHLSVHRPSARPPSACLRTFYSCSRSLSFRLSLTLFHVSMQLNHCPEIRQTAK